MTAPYMPIPALGRLHDALRDEDRAPDYRAYRDTLEQIAGKPFATLRTPRLLNELMSDATGQRGTSGFYLPGLDVVTTNAANSGYSGRQTVAHELGHRYDNTHPTAPAIQAAHRAPDAPKQFDGHDNYAAANRHEQTAMAFENAQRLIDHASEVALLAAEDHNAPAERAALREEVERMRFGRDLFDGERMAPGTGAMLAMMVSHPIYAKHPIQKFRDLVPALEAEAPAFAPRDATAVRR